MHIIQSRCRRARRRDSEALALDTWCGTVCAVYTVCSYIPERMMPEASPDLRIVILAILCGMLYRFHEDIHGNSDIPTICDR